MAFFKQPRSLSESFRLAIFLLRVAGLFPYIYAERSRKFYFSWQLFLVTLLHLAVYCYANFTLALMDFLDYSQPMPGAPMFAGFGNLFIRLSGVVVTLSVLAPVIVGRNSYVSTLNKSTRLLDEYVTLGIDVLAIYRRIYVFGLVLTAVIVVQLVFSAWHAVYFYELIAEKEAPLKFYVVIVMADYYKTMFLFNTWLSLMTVYCFSRYMNGFLKDLVRENKRRYYSQRRRQLSWVLNTK